MPNEEKPTHLDLFSGIGGFALAAHWAGFETVGFSEIDPHCCRVLKKHWPRVPNLGDIHSVRGRRRCSLLTGGFPCQPYSHAGEQRGQEDDRHLWPEMLRVISEGQPHWIVGENVAAIDGLALDDCISDLESIGYEVAPPLEIPACAAGAWHERNRVWIIANRPGVDVEKPEMVEPARSNGEFGGVASLLPCSIWQPDRETYIAEMVGEIYGVSEWTHRSKAIGNAIVPQVAYEILKAIRQQIA